MLRAFLCAAEEIRTPTTFRPLPPQSSASTSFATAARAANLMIVAILKSDLLNNVKKAEVCDLAPPTACAKAIAVAQATRRRSATGGDNGAAVGYITIFLKQL